MHVIKGKQLQLTTDNHHPITLVIILNIPRFLMTLYYKQQKQKIEINHIKITLKNIF